MNTELPMMLLAQDSNPFQFFDRDRIESGRAWQIVVRFHQPSSVRPERSVDHRFHASDSQKPSADIFHSVRWQLG